MRRHRGAVRHALLLALALLASCRAERASTDVTGDFSSDVRILSEVASGEAGSGTTTVKPECAAPADAGSGDVVDDSGSGDAGSGAPTTTTLRLQLKLTQPCGALPSAEELKNGLYAAVGVPAGVAANEFALELPFDATTDPSATLVVVVLSGAAVVVEDDGKSAAQKALETAWLQGPSNGPVFGATSAASPEMRALLSHVWLRKLGPGGAATDLLPCSVAGCPAAPPSPSPTPPPPSPPPGTPPAPSTPKAELYGEFDLALLQPPSALDDAGRADLLDAFADALDIALEQLRIDSVVGYSIPDQRRRRLAPTADDSNDEQLGALEAAAAAATAAFTIPLRPSRRRLATAGSLVTVGLQLVGVTRGADTDQTLLKLKAFVESNSQELLLANSGFTAYWPATTVSEVQTSGTKKVVATGAQGAVAPDDILLPPSPPASSPPPSPPPPPPPPPITVDAIPIEWVVAIAVLGALALCMCITGVVCCCQAQRARQKVQDEIAVAQQKNARDAARPKKRFWWSRESRQQKAADEDESDDDEENTQGTAKASAREGSAASCKSESTATKTRRMSLADAAAVLQSPSGGPRSAARVAPPGGGGCGGANRRMSVSYEPPSQVIATAKDTVPATGRAAYVMPPKEAPGALGTKVASNSRGAAAGVERGGLLRRRPRPTLARRPGSRRRAPAPGARQNWLAPAAQFAAAGAGVGGDGGGRRPRSAKGEARGPARQLAARRRRRGGVSALAELEAEEKACTMRSGTTSSADVGGVALAPRRARQRADGGGDGARAVAGARRRRAALARRAAGRAVLASRARDRVRARREERARGEGLID